jgi:Ni/Co efflux regulator RcnB
MKKVLSLVLAVVMMAAMFALAASAMVGDGYHNYGEIANVERKSIRLDAVKEDVYDEAQPIVINHPSIKNWETGETHPWYPRENGETPASGVAYIVYDTQYIWVYVEVTDATLNTKAPDAVNPEFQDYTNDSVEILVDWTNEALNVADDTPYQSRVTHEGYISARLGQSGTRLRGTAEQGSKVPVNWLQGTAKHTDKGYDCEFRIDIPAEKYEGKLGEYISLGFTINDYDSTGELKSRVMISSDPVNGSNQWSVNKIGYIKLNYAPYTADTTIIYVVVAMVAALAIGTVTVVSLRRRVTSK